MQRRSRRAFFHLFPVAPEPGANERLVSLACPRDRALQRQAMSTQRLAEVAKVVAHAKVSIDQLRKSLERPGFCGKACRLRPQTQVPLQLLPLRRGELGWPPRVRPSAQAARPALAPRPIPPRDALARNGEAPSELRLGELPALEEREALCRRSPTLLELGGSERGRLPRQIPCPLQSRTIDPMRAARFVSPKYPERH